MNTFSSCFLALAAGILIHLLPGNASATQGPVAPPSPGILAFSHPISSGESGHLLVIDDSERAMWFQLYLQRDGQLVFTKWVRRDELVPDPGSGNSGKLFPLDSFEAGEHSYWARSWEPVFGMSAWSGPFEFTVDCTPIQKCVPSYPTETSEVPEGEWPRQFNFNFSPLNETATWGQLEIENNEDSSILSQWVEYDYPGQNGVGLEQVDGLGAFLKDGDHDWRCREYSVCAGIGEWSDIEFCDLIGTNCSGPTPPPTLFFASNHLEHTSSNTSGKGNTPAFFATFNGFTWINLYLRNASSGQVFFNQWVQFTDSARISELLPKLPPGDYEVWSRSFHYQCGIGPWSESPSLEFTVDRAEDLSINFGNTQEIDQRGVGYTTFNPRAGIDWYRVYVTCGERVIMDQWVDVEDRTPVANGVYPVFSIFGARSISQVIRVDEPCGGEMTVWLQSYSTDGRYGEWSSRSTEAEFDGLAPESLGRVGPALTWETSGQNSGHYEIYASLNGKLYFTDTVEATRTAAHPNFQDFVDEWDLPRAYEPFFRLSDTGEIKFYVRNVCGAFEGAWSEPFVWQEASSGGNNGR